MKKLLLAIFIFSICLCSSLHAQLRMEFNAALNNTPFRVGYGDTLSYHVLLINNDSMSAIAAAVYVGFNGSNGVSNDSVFIGTFQILQGDTADAVIPIEVKPQYFKTGPEVVVVWPIFNGDRGEQLADFILVDGNVSSVEETETPIGAILITNNQITFKENTFKRVRISNLNGQLISEFQPETNQHPIPQLPPAMYVLQAVTTDNRNVAVKFISRP